jgi:hypothetical protein
MPPIDTKLIFAVLGPLFLILGLARFIKAGRMMPQTKTWLMIGVIFSAVAAWLWFGVGQVR